MDFLYVPRLDVETFVLNEVPAHGAITVRGRPLREKVLAARIREGSAEERGFLVAYAAVLSGERSQRTAIRRKLTRKTRNIELGVDTVQAYLTRTLTEEKKGLRSRKMQTEGYLTEAFRLMRQRLGLGDAQPSQFTYQISEDAVAAAGTPELKQQLRRLITRGDLNDRWFQQLKDYLEKDFPQEAAEVLGAVTATRSREHISAISVHSKEEKQFVSIVNTQGKRLTLLEHKFRDLLTHPNAPRLLHKYTWEDQKRKEVDFIFTEKTEGMVVAKLDTASCVLDVLCLDEESRSYQDRARFVLDLDYACCLYAVLKRTRDDRERFARLLEKAEASVGFDPFPEIFNPHYP